MAINEKTLQNIITNLISSSMREVREDKDLLDSYSPNQFLSKLNLINHIRSLNILNKDSEIVIFGSWYGSILIPAFYDEVKKITCIDQDPKVISRAKHNLFKDLDIDFITGDVFEFRDQYKTTDLFINTSCEHMKPMREWGPAPTYKNPWWDRVSPAYFAFQSNTMFDIPTHINCVNDIEEFIKQLPDRAEVLIEDKIADERGTRFTLIGKI
jgi:hypothetical protein|tara:strand:- start:3 stop:638 length:636 start_codon:yes stop_codon:yes gene_type:complete